MALIGSGASASPLGWHLCPQMLCLRSLHSPAPCPHCLALGAVSLPRPSWSCLGHSGVAEWGTHPRSVHLGRPPPGEGGAEKRGPQACLPTSDPSCPVSGPSEGLSAGTVPPRVPAAPLPTVC